ncbi:hypothetical protein DFP72DRAFT_781158, partial [Ephemerocybe angulata]
PCPGLSKHTEPLIAQYLLRTSVPSAGGVNGNSLAQSMFSIDSTTKLNEEQKTALALVQRQTHRWRLDQELRRVFAIGKESPCETTVTAPTLEDARPCKSCMGLLKLRAFRTAIRKEIPEDENRIFTPHQFQPAAIGKQYAKIKGLSTLFSGDV